MNARSLVVTIAALASAFAAFAQDPGFGDLAITETSTHTRSSTYRRIDVDVEALDAGLVEARELLDGVGENFRSIFLSAERLVREAGGNVALGHWSKERFLSSKGQAAELRARAARLEGVITRLVEYYAVLKVEDRHNYELLSSRHAKVICLLTEYNDLMAWASTYNLDFDTVAIFDEKDMLVLDRNSNPRVAFPILPVQQLQGTIADRSRKEVESRTGAPLIRKEETVVTTRSSSYRAVDRDELNQVLASAAELANRADEARSQILAWADDTTSRSLRFLGSVEDFEKKVKAQVVNFALTMLRLKGLRNAACSLLEGSDLLEGDLDVQARWQELSTRFADLAGWGDGTFLRYDSPFKTARSFVIFFRTNFTRTNLFTSAGSPAVTPTISSPRSRSLGSATPPNISVNDAFRLVKSVSGSTRRRDMCYRVIPQTRGLTAQDLSNLVTWIGDNGYAEAVVSFGLDYLNR